jgi:hypothetical protein
MVERAKESGGRHPEDAKQNSLGYNCMYEVHTNYPLDSGGQYPTYQNNLK